MEKDKDQQQERGNLIERLIAPVFLEAVLTIEAIQ